jgi:hypothetical protein
MAQAPSELAPDKSVFRLWLEAFVPAGQQYPNGEVFRPSSKDQEDAKARGGPVRVTVWDSQLTTPSQAKAFWGRSERAIAFELPVSGVVQLRQRYHRPELRVVRDPLDDPRPGAQGHCGFEGLDRKSGQPRTAHKTLLDDVAQLCREIARV